MGTWGNTLKTTFFWAGTIATAVFMGGTMMYVGERLAKDELVEGKTEDTKVEEPKEKVE